MEAADRTQGPASDRALLGEFIAFHRRAGELSLRQLAERAGISNPYISQIERGLRKPSAEVLQQLANALQVSSEQLYERAGLLDPEETRPTQVERAIRSDPGLTEAQKRALIDVYQAFNAPHSQPDPNLIQSDQATDNKEKS